ncbi:RNA polymerase sigma-70 factor (ECF subfamily) [Massilia sp. MP_M2]|uniref:RNA polymerase subunit sigma n=1 Tax=Massilia sp. MP_M2 TaxID=3071713 RepID=UPI00319DBD08
MSTLLKSRYWPPLSDTGKVDDMLRRCFCESDLRTLAILVTKYQCGVAALVNALVLSATVAQEVTREAFFHTYRRLTGLRFQRAFSTFLYAIARNLKMYCFSTGQVLAENALPMAVMLETTTRVNHSSLEGSEPDTDESPIGSQLVPGIYPSIAYFLSSMGSVLPLPDRDDFSEHDIAKQGPERANL